MTDKIQVICGTCGSADVRRDASASWHVENQEWVICSVYDDGNCEVCGTERELEDVSYDKWLMSLDDDDELNGTVFRAAQMNDGNYRAEVQISPAHVKIISKDFGGFPISTLEGALDVARETILKRLI